LGGNVADIREMVARIRFSRALNASAAQTTGAPACHHMTSYTVVTIVIATQESSAMACKKACLTAALGTAVTASLIATPAVRAADNPFEIQALERGYQVVALDMDLAAKPDKKKEGKCGEGKCGEGKCGGSK
jgi:uncharacterized low-complexity protein